MGIVAILFFFGALGVSLVWSLICAGLTAWLKKCQLPINFLTLASLNLGLALFPLHQSVLDWYRPSHSDHGVGTLLDLSILLSVVSVFLIHWVIVLWFERYRFWLSTLLVTLSVPGLCYAYYCYPNLAWVVLLIAVMIALQVELVWKGKQSKD